MDNNENLKSNYKKVIKACGKNKKAKIGATLVFAFLTVGMLFLPNNSNGDSIPPVTKPNTNSEKGMQVTFIDVGQGDSSLIEVNDKVMLIDAGPNSNADNVVKELRNKDIKDIDVVIATHPHEDHIGGMDEVFAEFNVKEFYSPKVEHTTQTYSKMINAVRAEGLKVKQIKEGTKLDLGENVKVDVFTPRSETYKDLNDYSPIMKISYGDISFMFTGDAEKENEEEAAKTEKNLKADVLKFGHHGSSTSSTNVFLDQVKPEYGVISCETGNKYGHPHKETLTKVDDRKIKLYRTDTQGTIRMSTNGERLNILPTK